MTTRAFEKIMDGLTDAQAFAEGDKSRGKAHEIDVSGVDLRAARRTLGLSQSEHGAAVTTSGPKPGK